MGLIDSVVKRNASRFETLMLLRLRNMYFSSFECW